MKVDGSRVLVTGASGAIGRALARELHGRGATVVLSGRRTEALEDLRRELGERAEVAAADLAEVGEAGRLADAAGAVDVLIANAGVPATGYLARLSPADIDRALDVNLRATLHLVHAVLPGMLERERGHVAVMSSLVGRMPTPVSSLACATKFGLRGFALALREDLRGSGVGVTVVVPGPVSEEGMFASAGVRLPAQRLMGAPSPAKVARFTVRGIERDRGEVAVGSLFSRAGAAMAGIAPEPFGRFGRRVGAVPAAEALAEGQRGWRAG